MKKRSKTVPFLSLIISLVLIAHLLGYRIIDYIPFDPAEKGLVPFDPAEKGLVQVTTECDGGPFTKEGIFCYVLADRQRIQSSDDFEPDETAVYDASSSLYSGIEDGKVVNHIGTVRILDESGNNVFVTEEFMDIVRLAAQIDHDVMTLKIMKTAVCTFVYIELNVNLWSPCELYYYHPDTRSLSKLYTWDDEVVTKIKVLNPHLLDNLRPTYKLKTAEKGV